MTHGCTKSRILALYRRKICRCDLRNEETPQMPQEDSPDGVRSLRGISGVLLFAREKEKQYECRQAAWVRFQELMDDADGLALIRYVCPPVPGGQPAPAGRLTQLHALLFHLVL